MNKDIKTLVILLLSIILGTLYEGFLGAPLREMFQCVVALKQESVEEIDKLNKRVDSKIPLLNQLDLSVIEGMGLIKNASGANNEFNASLISRRTHLELLEGAIDKLIAKY